MSRRRGFTIIELLVVIGLIAALAAMLLPVASRAREQARQVQCLSNMHQLTMALLRYTQDFGDQFLPLSSASAQAGLATGDNESQVIPALLRYAPQPHVFHCPSDYRDGALTYSINDYLGGTWPSYTPALRTTQIKHSAQVFAMIEEVDLHPKVALNPGGFVVESAPVWIDFPAVLHRNGTCLTFVDGHGEFWVWSDPRTAAITNHLTPSMGNLDLVSLQNVQGAYTP